MEMCTHAATVTVCAHTRLCTRAWERAGHMRLLHQQGRLVPRPTRFFCSSVCVDNNTQMRKSGEEWERPGIIHHVSDVRHQVDVEGVGPVVISAGPEAVHHPVGLVQTLHS